MSTLSESGQHQSAVGLATRVAILLSTGSRWHRCSGQRSGYRQGFGLFQILGVAGCREIETAVGKYNPGSLSSQLFGQEGCFLPALILSFIMVASKTWVGETLAVPLIPQTTPAAWFASSAARSISAPLIQARVRRKSPCRLRRRVKYLSCESGYMLRSVITAENVHPQTATGHDQMPDPHLMPQFLGCLKKFLVSAENGSANIL